MVGIVTPPNTEVQLTHALVIKVAPGKIVGAVNEWNPRQSQDLADLYEFGNATRRVSRGAPFEIAPGNIRSQQIDVRRYDLYVEQMEEAFGSLTSGMNMLGDRNDPFELYEEWLAPTNKPKFRWVYRTCWFEQIGRTLSSTGDRVVNVNAVIRYLEKFRVRI